MIEKNSIILLNSIDKVKKFVNITSSFSGEIDIIEGRHIINGKSIMGIFSLNLSRELIINIMSSTQEETDEFLKQIKEYMI